VRSRARSCVRKPTTTKAPAAALAGGRMRIRRLAALAACSALGVALMVARAGAADPDVIEAAKKEGKLVVYTGVERAAGQALVSAFQKKYPFVAAESVRASSSKLATRLDAEIAADRVQSDVFEFSLLYLTKALQKRGELLKYDSPEYVHYPAPYAAPGCWAATGASDIRILRHTGKR